jgi:hypothetical protein
MNSEVILIYALKSTVVTAILYAYYLIALRDTKFHYYNRFYLLGSLILSLTIPFLDLHWFTFERPVTESTNLELIQLITASSNQIIEQQFTWIDGLLIGAGIIAFIFLAMLVISIWKIFNIKRKSPIRYLDGIDFIETEVENAPFSFLNNLFWKKTMSLEDDKGQKIFKHELTHIRQKHSWDRLFCQVLSSIFWINPFNWIIQKELQTIHEFIADEEAIGNQNTEAFAKLLLETHYGTHFLNPIHPFNYSSIKRRLAMLTKSNKTEYSYLRRVMALPIMLIALAIFSIKVNAVNRIQNLENKIEEAFIESQADTIKEKASGEKKAVILEKINSDKGTEKKKIVIIDGKATISDLKPEDIESIQMIKKEGLKIEAINSKEKTGKELRIEGVEFKGEVDNNDIMIITAKSKNGESKKIYMIDPSDKSENKKLFIVDQNSKDAIENAVKKINGRETMNVTVTDIREEVKADTVIVERAKSGKNDIGEAVYMLDGKKVDSSVFKNLKPDDIQSVTVIKGENAEKKYGDLKGKGVIEIITKKK